jgi:hypothetical protein
MTIVIHKPLENIIIGGRHTIAVGIPLWRLRYQPSMVTIDIQYKYRSGSYRERQFPNLFQISKSEILKCQSRKQGPKEDDLFYIVPIEKMTELKQHEEHKNPEDAITRESQPKLL